MPAVIALALGVRLAVAGAYRFFIDDTYIFLRYANNFAAGHGLVFNPGEWVLGFSSPLYMLVLAVLTRAFPSASPVLLIGVVTGVLFLGFGAIVARWCLTGRLASWAIVLFLLFYFPFVDSSLNGMETTLMLTTMAGSLYLLEKRRNGAATIVGALCALTRPEGFFFFALLVAFLFVFRRSELPWRSLVVAAVLGLAWAALAYHLYGTILPQSMLAKASLMRTEGRVSHNTPAEMHLFLSLALPDTRFHGAGMPVRLALAGLTVGLSALFVTGLVDAVRRRSALAVLAAFYVVTLAFYIVGNPIDLSSWHVIPTCFAFMVPTFSGLAIVLDRIRARWLEPAIVWGVVAGCTLSAMALPTRAASINDVQGSMERLADYVRRELPAAHSIASTHIGMLGYRSGLRIVDLGGLVTPAAMKDRYVSDTVAREKPDVVMLAPTVLEEGKDRTFPHAFRSPQAKAEFLADYEPVFRPGLPSMFVRRGQPGAPPAP